MKTYLLKKNRRVRQRHGDVAKWWWWLGSDGTGTVTHSQ